MLHAQGPGELTWMEPGSSDRAKVAKGFVQLAVLSGYLRDRHLYDRDLYSIKANISIIKTS